MDIGVIGINHRSSPLILREKLTKVLEAITPALPVVLLSTCNRTEVYFSSDDLMQTQKDLLLQMGVVGDVINSLYSYFGSACFLHLAGVTTGVDSALFGEGQIQGQVRRAYTVALKTKALPAPLHYAFQKSLKVGKKLRTQFHLPKGQVSLESILWDLTRCFYLHEAPISLLLIGNSEINRKMLPFFTAKKRFAITLVTKETARAQDLACRYGITLKEGSELSSWGEYDLIIAASKSTQYLVKPYEGTGPIKTRLIVDLSMPRGVDPLVEEMASLTLLNIQDIGELTEQKQRISHKERKEIGEMVEKSVESQIASYFKHKRRALSCV